MFSFNLIVSSYTIVILFCDVMTEKKKKKVLVQLLLQRGYDPDPVKKWREAQKKLQVLCS